MRRFVVGLLFMMIWALPAVGLAQEATPATDPALPEETPAEAPQQVDVEPTAQDYQIDQRLTRILTATSWFIDPQVEVQDGVVFLDGQTKDSEYRDWAGNLARNTQDVVAVVNRIQVIPPSIFDFSPAIKELRSIWRSLIQATPIIIFAAITLYLSWKLAELTANLGGRSLEHRLDSPLLAAVVSRSIAVLIFLLGLYLVLQVAGLTRLAVTVLGGTGLFGIVIGFGFRDIAENFLSSMILSMRRPFQINDYIAVDKYEGIVQEMNTRSTILMTTNGNHIQIPNATIFKSIILNYTANPNRRFDYTVGIGYEEEIPRVQEIIANLLANHPMVLADPKPLALVEELGPSSIRLHVYFWCDANRYDPLKVRSSLIRQTKRLLEDEGVSMPDEQREIIFPRGVPLEITGADQPNAAVQLPTLPVQQPKPRKETPSPGNEPLAVDGEGDLSSDAGELREQAERARSPEEGPNLLKDEAPSH